MRFGLERIRRLVARARHAAAPVRLDPRRRHQRQVVGDRDHGGAARGARAAAPAPTSRPHDERWRERVRIGGAEIDAASRSAPRSSGSPQAVEAVEPRARGGRVGDPVRGRHRRRVRRPRRRRVEVGVIEAGLGGRLDATNVLPSRVTVLTSVGLEHTEYLGDTEAGDRGREARRAARPLDPGDRAARPEVGGARRASREPSAAAKLVTVRDLAPAVDAAVGGALPAPQLRGRAGGGRGDRSARSTPSACSPWPPGSSCPGGWR